MLPKRNRPTRTLVGTMGGSPVAAQGRFIRVRIRAVEGPPQLSVVVSSKNIRSAAERNKLRRRVRAVMYELLPSLRSGNVAVIYMTRDIKKAHFAELREDIKKTLEIAKLIS